MAAEIPKTIKQWNVTGKSFVDSLEFSEQPVPEIGDTQVLVKLHAASLNFRDLGISQGTYAFPLKDNVIPGSDGAGTVLAVGKSVTRFRPGDKVVTLFNQQHYGGAITADALQSGLGGAVDGTLRTAAAFDQQGLVSMPAALSFAEAATLTCAGVTAWNALYGAPGNVLAAGQWVLTQGTGGVSVFAVQLAKAAGARVIATTSSADKARLLEKLGADHVINYKETTDWGAKAKELTGGVGVDHVVEVGGPASMAQSFAAVAVNGMISIIGFVGGVEATSGAPSFLMPLMRLCTVRGFLVGSRAMMEDLCRAIDANPEGLRPVVDAKTFKLEELKEAYAHMHAGKHQGKIVVEID